jgi:hypothetical protein
MKNIQLNENDKGIILYHKKYKKIMTLESYKNYTNYNNENIVVLAKDVELKFYNVFGNALVSDNA